MPLDAEQLRAAVATITAWRADPVTPAPCPACGRPGLSIVDRSARPYAEWYALACAACALDETLHIPLGPPLQPVD
jgi:hypothetical protein